MFDRNNFANPNVSSWNTSSATNLYFMFQKAKAANPDVSAWDVSNVADFRYAFAFADLANPDLSLWDFSGADLTKNGLNHILRSSGVSCENISNFLDSADETLHQLMPFNLILSRKRPRSLVYLERAGLF